MSKLTYFAVSSSIQGLLHQNQALLPQIQGENRFQGPKSFSRSIPGSCEPWQKIGLHWMASFGRRGLIKQVCIGWIVKQLSFLHVFCSRSNRLVSF